MRTLSELTPELTLPFPSHQIDLKPGATTRDKDRALALAYADVRVYQERLDQVVGPDAWSVHFDVRTLGVICTLEICGVAKADIGDYPPDLGDRPNENKATTAAAQAFKRACAQFGLGRYLYSLPRLWADYEADQKAFVNPQRVVIALYTAAGLGDCVTDETARQAREHAESADVPAERLAPARAALAAAEAKAAHLGRPSAPSQRSASNKAASEKQLRYLASLLKETRASADDLDGLAHQVGLSASDLSDIEALSLSAKVASTLIEELLALQDLHAA
jgi:hypothetical protein